MDYKTINKDFGLIEIDYNTISYGEKSYSSKIEYVESKNGKLRLLPVDFEIIKKQNKDVMRAVIRHNCVYKIREINTHGLQFSIGGYVFIGHIPSENNMFVIKFLDEIQIDKFRKDGIKGLINLLDSQAKNKGVKENVSLEDIL